MLQPMNFKVFVWTGEYQWPFEPELKIQLRGETGSGKPYNGQPGWGRCSNGQTTNLTWSMLAPLQPNNYNGAEDCMGRALLGYADNVCTESLPCLCEWQPDGSSRTTSAYKNIHGPALTKRAIEATELVYTTIVSSFVGWGLLGCLPALMLVVIIEGYFIRWRQRAVPATKEESILQATVRLALRRRMRQSGGLLLFGGLLFGLSIPILPLVSTGAWPSYGIATFPIGHPLFYNSLRIWGVFLIMMILTPTDTLGIRIVGLGWPIFVGLSWWTHEKDMVENGWPEFRPPWAKTTVFILRPIFMTLSLASAVFWRRHALPSRLALRWLWICIRIEYAIVTLEWVWMVVSWWGTPMRDPIGYGTGFYVLSATLNSVFLTARLRQYIQGLFGGGSGSASAASIVQTMVNGDAIAAMRSAHSRMYCIKLSSLKEADMANNQDSGLFAKTERAGPGECDAFLSHSWRDDAPLKWARMLEFKQEFEAAHGGTEPRCWLDKACIDQAGDIDASLKALPIFLLESQSFVVFAGATYTQRLWCVLEMFTFMRSGGALNRIVLKPLSSKTAEIVAKFDIASAQCFHRRDRHALLAVVESSYGSFGQFNAACRKILIAKLSAERGGPSSQSKTTQASTVLFSRDVRGADEITV